MTMPVNLAFIRHGESEGNAANALSYKGDHTAFDPDFYSRHSATWRLTTLGIKQAAAASAWLQANGLGRFDRHYTS